MAKTSAITLKLSHDTGTSSTDQITNDGTVSVSGLQSGGTSRYSLDGGNHWTTFTGSNFILNGDGAKSVLVQQIDSSGNIRTSSALSFTLDTTVDAPAISLAEDTGSSKKDGITNNGTVNVGGLEAGAKGQYSTDGGAHWTNFTGSSFTLSGNGTKNIQVRQIDTAGNVSGSSALSFTLDQSVATPTLKLATDSGTSSSDKITNNGTVTVTGLESGATAQYSTDGGVSWTTFTGNSFTLTGDGAKSVLVHQTDVAGNTAASAAFNFTLDTSAAAPTASLAHDNGSSSTDKITNDGTVTVAGFEAGARGQYSPDRGAG